MADEATTDAPVTEPITPDVDDEPRIPRERLNQEAKKRKEAEKQLADMRARLEELEASGLSELEQAKKRAEQLEKRAAEAEAEREQIRLEAQKSRAENWVSAAAAAAGFEDAEDAVLRIKADEIESPEDAERAVKRLAKAKPRLLKAEDPQLPGKVLENGQVADPAKVGTTRGADEEFARGMLDEINKIRTPAFPAASMFPDFKPQQ